MSPMQRRLRDAQARAMLPEGSSWICPASGADFVLVPAAA